MSVTRLALGFALVIALGSALAIALALAAVSPAGAQGPDVQITRLECIDDPDAEGIQEVVVIENLGDAAQTLTGWELQSDPPDSETFDLVVLGGLAPGASISIQSGPSASGVFKWGLTPIYRDNDPTDYARIVDDTGAIVHQVNCAGPTDTDGDGLTDDQEQQLETDPNNPDTDADGLTDGDEENVHGTNPLVADTDGDGSTDGQEIAQGTDPLDASSTPPNGVPNGGGPPPIAEGAVWPVVTLLIGGSIAVAGVALIALPRLRLRPALAVAASSPQRDYRGGGGTRRGRSSTALGLTLVGLCAVAMFLILRRRA